MGAPKGNKNAGIGNKNALGNDGGRPAMDLVQLAKDLIEWSYQPDALNLIGFSSPRRMSVTKLPEWAERDSEFREALCLAKQNIGQNRFKAACSNLMPQQFFTRSEGMYDPLHHRYDRAEKKFESDLRKQEDGAKATTINLTVPNDLAAGLNLPTKTISVKDSKGSK